MSTDKKVAIIVVIMIAVAVLWFMLQFWITGSTSSSVSMG